MTTKWEYEWNGSAAEIVCDDRVEANDPIFLAIASMVYDLHAVVPLDEFAVKLDAGVVPRQHHYKLIAVDGREYHQRLRVPVGDALYRETTMINFDVADFFSRKELEPHRLLREKIIDAIALKNLMKIEVEF